MVIFWRESVGNAMFYKGFSVISVDYKMGFNISIDY